MQTPLQSTPLPEINITSKLVQELLDSQHPDLAHLPLKHLDSGWDNTLFRLGKEYILRIPRRKVAVKLLRKEQKWLPILAKQLPIEVPTPIRIGIPDQNYPWHWSITPYFEGQAAAIHAPNENQAIVIANFLKALHITAPEDAPVSLLRGVPLAVRAVDVESRLQRLKEKTDKISPKIEEIWKAALSAPIHHQNCWIHGDLHSRNIVVHNGKIRAVIDWGDMTSGDVATDLACLWMLFKKNSVRQTAIEAYQPSPDLLARAKGWAVFFGAVLLETGLVDNPIHAEIGRGIFENLHFD
ncbi:MAG: aminoglycoside phosphotransferase family protein [Chitinophagales bacterium]